MTRLTSIPQNATPGSSWFRTLSSKEDYERAESLDKLVERLHGKSLTVFGETKSGAFVLPSLIALVPLLTTGRLCLQLRASPGGVRSYGLRTLRDWEVESNEGLR